MERDPLAVTEERWEEYDAGINMPFSFPMKWYRRSTDGSDGVLFACVALEPQGWHMSISYRDLTDELSRYPSWDEISHARDCLLPDDSEFVMFLPTRENYVSLHKTTFHLHEYPARQ